MLEKIKESILVINQILFKRNYFLIFLIASAFGFILLYKLTLATVAEQSLGIFIQMSGLNYTFFNLLILAVISLLFGIFLSLFVYRIKLARQVSKTGFFGTIGLAAGLFSP